ncbi:hypothetical protein GUJ93_ZPchr0006g42161 [Zizania palustris]|uniref:Uncharacterized protein n=1 Tax=Zizania palustris TaxID=103762 RepID=A0A8J5T0Q0_ZIZPA|nr:hypothetical protein GUJ93_ZPchr0006g42161 [Zizania palustris]
MYDSTKLRVQQPVYKSRWMLCDTGIRIIGFTSCDCEDRGAWQLGVELQMQMPDSVIGLRNDGREEVRKICTNLREIAAASVISPAAVAPPPAREGAPRPFPRQGKAQGGPPLSSDRRGGSGSAGPSWRQRRPTGESPAGVRETETVTVTVRGVRVDLNGPELQNAI